jgi:hypothetical protein
MSTVDLELLSGDRVIMTARPRQDRGADEAVRMTICQDGRKSMTIVLDNRDIRDIVYYLLGMERQSYLDNLQAFNASMGDESHESPA